MPKKSKKMKSKKMKSKKMKSNKNKTQRVYNKKDYKSGDGMLTSIWGPSLWHYLHTMSFNYPVCPSQQEKKAYKNFMMSLKKVLPCKYCRINMVKNLKAVPLNNKALKNRTNFSKWMFQLHEHINKMLKKKSGLTYCDVRERYEHFRSRCTNNKPKLFKFRKTRKEKGCTEPLYGKKSKCIIKIVPQEERCKTLQIDKKCIKSR